MKIETQISKEQYLRLLMNLFIRKPIFIFFAVVGILLFFCYFFNWNIEGNTSTPIYYLFFALFFLVINPFIFYMSMQKQISQNPELTEKISYEFTESLIKMTGESFQIEIPWNQIKKIKIYKNWISIYQNNNVTNFISIKDFKENWSDFQSLLKRKIK